MVYYNSMHCYTRSHALQFKIKFIKSKYIGGIQNVIHMGGQQKQEGNKGLEFGYQR